MAITAAGTSGQTLVSVGASAPVWANSYTGFKNFVMNPDFKINQRQFSSSTTNGTYGFDRWLQGNSGGTVTMSAQTFALGSPAVTGYESDKYLRLVVASQTTSGHYGHVNHRIENVRTLAGETVTVSFYAKAASGTPKIGVELGQWFGTGGSPSAEVQNALGAVTLSTSWARYSLTFTLPSLSGKTLGTTIDNFLNLILWCSAGTTYGTRSSSIGLQNNTFDIWGVQIERGSYATPLEIRPYQMELDMCMRFFQRHYYFKMHGGTTSVGTAGRFGAMLPVPLRLSTSTTTQVITPTIGGSIALYDGQYTVTASTYVTNYSTNEMIEMDLSHTAMGLKVPVMTYQDGNGWYIQIANDL
jgi:hypothetical protein